MVIENLRQIDEVAYVRYAAMYKKFVDAELLMEQPQDNIIPKESD
jgi:transcriptional regulator NrdR family protein